MISQHQIIKLRVAYDQHQAICEFLANRLEVRPYKKALCVLTHSGRP